MLETVDKYSDFPLRILQVACQLFRIHPVERLCNIVNIFVAVKVFNFLHFK